MLPSSSSSWLFAGFNRQRPLMFVAIAALIAYNCGIFLKDTAAATTANAAAAAAVDVVVEEGLSDNMTTKTTPLKIMFCGLGRTGSHSLAEALTRLGYKPCHGSDIVKNIYGSHKVLAETMMTPSTYNNITKILEETSKLGCDVTMEAHAAYCPEIFHNRQHFGGGLIQKDIKFIFTHRKSMETWLKSFASMRSSVAPMNRYPLRFIPAIEATFQWSSKLAIINAVATEDERITLEDFVSGTNILEEGSIIRHYHEQSYKENYQFTMQAISEDPQHAMLLDLDVMNQFGYKPLCEFLDIHTSDCPTISDEPYPHAGSTNAMKANGRILLTLEAILYLMMFGLGYGLWKLGKQITVKLTTPTSSSPSLKKVK